MYVIARNPLSAFRNSKFIMECVGRDSNPRSPKALGLQPSAIDRSATHAHINIDMVSKLAPRLLFELVEN